MKQSAVQIDLDVLPESGRRELFDFYLALLSRYQAKTVEGEKRLEKLIGSPLAVKRIELPSRDQRNERKSLY